MGKGGGQTTFVSAECPDIAFYYFLGDAGAVTLKGCLYDLAGNQKWLSVSLSIPQGTGAVAAVNLKTLVAAALGSAVDIKDWVGFVGNTSGAIRWTTVDPNLVAPTLQGTTFTTGALILTDFMTNYTNYPLLASGNSIAFGSVAMI